MRETIVIGNGIKKGYDLADLSMKFMQHQVKEAKELAEIIEMDRGITMTINTAHHHNLGKPKKLKPYWKNGKLKYK